jgi:hypothetical protein
MKIKSLISALIALALFVHSFTYAAQEVTSAASQTAAVNSITSGSQDASVMDDSLQPLAAAEAESLKGGIVWLYFIVAALKVISSSVQIVVKVCEAFEAGKNGCRAYEKKEHFDKAKCAAAKAAPRNPSRVYIQRVNVYCK